MKYKPFAVGECDFKITSAEESVSKAGNEQMIIDFLLKDVNDTKMKCRDYYPANLAWKISALKKELEQDDNGEIEVKDIVGQSGKCITYLTHSDQYGSQVKIKGFPTKITQSTQATGEPNDDVPF